MECDNLEYIILPPTDCRTQMTKHIRVRASGGNDDSASELASFTPKFLWLLRDFYLRLEEDGRQVGCLGHGSRRAGAGQAVSDGTAGV